MADQTVDCHTGTQGAEAFATSIAERERAFDTTRAGRLAAVQGWFRR